MEISKSISELKYKHRAFYVFIVLFGTNAIWYMFSSYKHSLKQLIFGFLITLSFAVFYFLIKNLKRKIVKIKSLKNIQFFGSVTFIPVAYICLILLILLIPTTYSFIIGDDNNPKINKTFLTDDLTMESPQDSDDLFLNKTKNLISFANTSLCGFAVLPLSLEYSYFQKNYYQENILNKKPPTSEMLLVSLLFAVIMQIISISISEKVIFRLVNKKRRKSLHSSKKHVLQTA